MEFTFTFAEIINKIIDLSLLGMESFIAIWLFAAFAASTYSDSISLPATPTMPVSASLPSLDQPAVKTNFAPVQEIVGKKKVTREDLAKVTELTYRSLRKIASSLQIKYYGMNKESMLSELLERIERDSLDVELLLSIAT